MVPKWKCCATNTQNLEDLWWRKQCAYQTVFSARAWFPPEALLKPLMPTSDKFENKAGVLHVSANHAEGAERW